MSFNTLFFKHLLVGAALLPGLALSSPVGSVDARGVKVISAPLENVTPTIIDHGPLDLEGLERLKDSLTKSIRPTPTPEANRIKRQDVASSTVNSLTIATSDAFVSVDIGDINLVDSNSANCHSEELNGPFDSIQFFTGTTNMRAINATSSSGNTSSITSVSKTCHS